MSEKPQTIGVKVDVDSINAEFNRDRNAAQRMCDAAITEIDKPLQDLSKAMYRLLPDDGEACGQAEAVIHMVDSLSNASRSVRRARVREARDLAIRAATARREEALTSDPFGAFIHTYIRDEHGESFADTFFNALPCTVEDLKRLADSHRWCTDFEAAMQVAADRGALPDESTEVTRPCPLTAVPSSYNARHGQPWQATFTVPLYVRTVDSLNTPVSYRTLVRYAIGDVVYSRTDADLKSSAESGDTSA